MSPKNKKVTYSSVLSARSKAACGIVNKPKIIDIDESDKDNHLAAVEYVDDMYSFYKEVEKESQPKMYMHIQTEMNEKMRAILIDWLLEVHIKFELNLETLYLTVNIIDRFLSVKAVPKRELQLVGISALLIASKYEEIWPPQVLTVCFQQFDCVFTMWLWADVHVMCRLTIWCMSRTMLTVADRFWWWRRQFLETSNGIWQSRLNTSSLSASSKLRCLIQKWVHFLFKVQIFCYNNVRWKEIDSGFVVYRVDGEYGSLPCWIGDDALRHLDVLSLHACCFSCLHGKMLIEQVPCLDWYIAVPHRLHRVWDYVSRETKTSKLASFVLFFGLLIAEADMVFLCCVIGTAQSF